MNVKLVVAAFNQEKALVGAGLLCDCTTSSINRFAALVQSAPDGLAQKAGCAQEAVLEVAGSWYDPCNPVLARGGQPRPELKV